MSAARSSSLAALSVLFMLSSACGGAGGAREPARSVAYGGAHASVSGGRAPGDYAASSMAKGEAAPTGTGSAAAPVSATADPPHTTSTSSTPPTHARAVDEDQASPTGGVLTAAIWDDNSHRSDFRAFEDRYPAFQKEWGLDLAKRVTITVKDQSGVAVADAPIALRTPDGSIVNLRTHGDGNAYFWPGSSSKTDQALRFAVAAEASGLRAEATFDAPSSDTTWTVKLPGNPTRAKEAALDVAFVVDCTGSMGDEISYLQNELAGVVKRVKKEHATRRLRLGLVLYRDRGDEYVTKVFPFTEDLSSFLDHLKTARAEGGGDMPESVNAALADTVKSLSWAGDETGRLAILVADAPPHYYADEQYTYKNALPDLASKGVKLVTLGASGIDKTTEYLFRQMSAYTGGRYVFLTDDSGVGDSHIKPDISGYQVEHLDQILARVIREEAASFAR